MGEKSRRVADPERNSPREVERLESEIARSRRRLDAYVDELDRRRHRLLSVRKHPGLVVGAAVGAIAVIGTSIVLVRRRRRPMPRARQRAKAFQEAFGRMTRHPERVATEGKSSWPKMLITAAPAIARVLLEASRRRRDSTRR